MACCCGASGCGCSTSLVQSLTISYAPTYFSVWTNGGGSPIPSGSFSLTYAGIQTRPGRGLVHVWQYVSEDGLIEVGTSPLTCTVAFITNFYWIVPFSGTPGFSQTPQCQALLPGRTLVTLGNLSASQTWAVPSGFFCIGGSAATVNQDRPGVIEHTLNPCPYFFNTLQTLAGGLPRSLLTLSNS